MKKLLLVLLFSLYCFGGNIDLTTYLKNKDYLNSIIVFNSFISGNLETIAGSNLITISLINVNGEKVEFKILKEQSMIITDCDFTIRKYNNNFSSNIDNDCNKYFTKNAQEQYMLDTLKSVESKINFIYNKGEVKE